jgi:hypothetical protein
VLILSLSTVYLLSLSAAVSHINGWRCAPAAENGATWRYTIHQSHWAPTLSKIERRELQDIIIRRFQGTENTNDSEIAEKNYTLHYLIYPQCPLKYSLLYSTTDAPSKPLGRRSKITENI